MDYNDQCVKQATALCNFLEQSWIKKIKLLPEGHRTDWKQWDAFTNANQISQHLRFRLNLFAMQGVEEVEDDGDNDNANNNNNENEEKAVEVDDVNAEEQQRQQSTAVDVWMKKYIQTNYNYQL